MWDQDFIYGCRSGIQKGIRRGDLDLVNTCFEALWEKDDQHRDWLRWRTHSITIEECFHLTGELAKLLATNSRLKADWKKFIFKLCIATKSKDCPGLWSFIHHKGRSKHLEFKELRYFRKYADREYEGDYLKVVNEVYVAYMQGTDERQLDLYEHDAMNVFHNRSLGGGMLNDRYFAFTGMILLFLRGLDEAAVNEDLKKGRDRWVKKVNGRTKPRTVSLPWYVFDKHTQVGREAIGKILSRWNQAGQGRDALDEYHLDTIWFYLESAKTGKDMINIVAEEREGLTALDSMWWLKMLRHRLSLNDHLTPKKCAQMWKRDGLAELTEEVTWEIIEKRKLTGK
jgi:hypothetical protein